MPPANISQPFRDSFRVLLLYVRGKLILGLILTVLYSLAFWAIHVPYWGLIGVLGGLACLVPGVGSLLPLGLAALALAIADAPVKSYLLLVGSWLVIYLLELFVLVPRVIGRPMGLKELPVLAAVLLGSLFFGPIGLLLAIPVLAVATVFWRYFRRPKQIV